MSDDAKELLQKALIKLAIGHPTDTEDAKGMVEEALALMEGPSTKPTKGKGWGKSKNKPTDGDGDPA